MEIRLSWNNDALCLQVYQRHKSFNLPMNKFALLLNHVAGELLTLPPCSSAPPPWCPAFTACLKDESQSLHDC